MPGQSSQQFVPIKEIRDGVVVLHDGSLRMVLMASSLNFALKSGDEQEAIILQFQSFLNSLDFSVQFFIESRELDIRPYIALLEKRRTEQTSDLMKIQVAEYVEFIKKFTENVNIMTKTFFVVVPYARPILGKKGGVLAGLIPKKSKKREEEKAEEAESFEEMRTQLEQRVSVVEQGLARTGVRIAALGTDELIELYFKIFNPGEQQKPLAPGRN
ncbi:MAG: hypothetical protein AAB727_00465 [Patescibacteria group bacterium]